MNGMKPILFNTEMVRAILEGRKTVTRRVVKPQPKGRLVPTIPESCWPGYFAEVGTPRVAKPPYRPGDILYVRETWEKTFGVFWYKASLLNKEEPGQIPGMIGKTKWRPSIHMPHEAARIFLRVTDVRVERLQDITENQAEKEGVYGTSEDYGIAMFAFSDIWNSTIKKTDRALYGWNANPWVWVIEFERIEANEV